MLDRQISIEIDMNKSNALKIKGTLTLDGIGILFTAYRRCKYLTGPTSTGSYSWSNIVVRSRNGILETFEDKDRIKAAIKNKSRGWWIDNGKWEL